MTFETIADTSAFQTSYYRDPDAGTSASAEAAIAASEASAPKAPKTKEERIAGYREQIARLEAKIADLIAGKEAAPKAPKVPKVPKIAPLPAVGETLTFTFGRKTPTSNPQEKTGVVVAVRPQQEQVLEGGATRRTPAQVKVQVGDGFDAEFCVIYLAQIKLVPTPVDEFANI